MAGAADQRVVAAITIFDEPADRACGQSGGVDDVIAAVGRDLDDRRGAGDQYGHGQVGNRDPRRWRAADSEAAGAARAVGEGSDEGVVSLARAETDPQHVEAGEVTIGDVHQVGAVRQVGLQLLEAPETRRGPAVTRAGRRRPARARSSRRTAWTQIAARAGTGLLEDRATTGRRRARGAGVPDPENPEEDWREVPGTGRRLAFLEVKTVWPPAGIMRSVHDPIAYLTGELH
jgi:hypothetical protein